MPFQGAFPSAFSLLSQTCSLLKNTSSRLELSATSLRIAPPCLSGNLKQTHQQACFSLVDLPCYRASSDGEEVISASTYAEQLCAQLCARGCPCHTQCLLSGLPTCARNFPLHLQPLSLALSQLLPILQESGLHHLLLGVSLNPLVGAGHACTDAHLLSYS